MQNRNDSYFKVYKTTALQMSDFTNSMQLYVYEHAVVDLSDRYWRGQSDVNSHCSIFLTTCRNAEVQCGGEPTFAALTALVVRRVHGHCGLSCAPRKWLCRPTIACLCQPPARPPEGHWRAHSAAAPCRR